MNLIDIHCHILPKVDDGPDTVEESVRILAEMRKQGVMHAIVTPHYRKEMFEPSMKRVLPYCEVVEDKQKQKLTVKYY